MKKMQPSSSKLNPGVASDIWNLFCEENLVGQHGEHSKLHRGKDEEWVTDFGRKLYPWREKMKIRPENAGDYRIFFFFYRKRIPENGSQILV